MKIIILLSMLACLMIAALPERTLGEQLPQTGRGSTSAALQAEFATSRTLNRSGQSTASIAPAPPDERNMIVQCYDAFQKSRITAFLSRNVSDLRCVEPGSQLWMHVAAGLEDLRQAGHRRQISEREDRWESIEVEGSRATIVVRRAERHREIDERCISASADVCHALTEERIAYPVIYTLHRDSSGFWQMDGLTIPDA